MRTVPLSTRVIPQHAALVGVRQVGGEVADQLAPLQRPLQVLGRLTEGLHAPLAAPCPRAHPADGDDERK